VEAVKIPPFAELIERDLATLHKEQLSPETILLELLDVEGADLDLLDDATNLDISDDSFY
jgi:hypothetical protein